MSATAERLELGRRRLGPGRWRVSRRLVRAAAAYAATSLVLLGVSAGAPGWQPAPTLPPLGAVPAPVVPGWEKHLPYAQVDRYPTTVETDAGPARAWVVVPRGAPDGLPAVVLVPGAGARTRDDLADEAEALARGGVAVLTYDKRRSGYSALSRDYAVLATDALAALDVLARQPGVDPGRVGLLGWSEGGWVVPLAAEQAPDRVAFVVLVSAPLVTPLQQAVWVADRRLAAAPELVRRAAAVGLTSGRGLVSYLDADVAPALRAGRTPVHAVWGAADEVVPVAAAAEVLRASAGSRASVEVVPGAGHHVGVASGWAERVSDWVRRGLPGDPEVRGVEPDTSTGLAVLPETVPDPRGQVLLAAVVGALAGLWPAGPRLRRARPASGSSRRGRSGSADRAAAG